MRASQSWLRVIRDQWAGYTASVLAVGLASGVVGLAAGLSGVDRASMLYLIVVLAIAALFGSGPAILASVLAFLVFNFYFIEPLHTLRVADPDQWIALLLFLLTAVITGQLAAALRRRAHLAEQREREALVLYDVVRLMGEPDLQEALRTVGERLREELGLSAVAIDISTGTGNRTCAESGDAGALLCAHTATASSQLLAEGAAPSGSHHGVPGRWVRIVPPHLQGKATSISEDRLRVVPVKAQGRKVGSILLLLKPDAPGFAEPDDQLLSAAATQLGLAVERAGLREEATEGEILRRADEMKTQHPVEAGEKAARG